MRSKSKELWNPAGVSFYEDLVTERDLWESIAQWICPDVKPDVEVLWDLHLSAEALSEFLAVWDRQRGTRARETVFHTGEIFKL